MKTIVLITAIALSFMGMQSLQAQSFADLSRSFDLHGSVRDLTTAARDGSISSTKLYLLSGNLETLTLKSKEPFSAEASFIEAYWHGYRAIEQYPAILLFRQPGFAKLVSVDRNIDDPAILTARKNVLAIVRFVELRSVDGVQTPVLDVLDFRIP